MADIRNPLMDLYGEGYQNPAVHNLLADPHNESGQAPTYSLAQALAAYRPHLADHLPTNTDLPAPRFPFDPRSLSALNMIHGGVRSAQNWLERRPEVGPDTLAPLGLAALNPMGRIAEGAMAQGATLSKNAYRWPWSPNDAFKYKIMKDGDRIGTAEGRVNGTEAYIRWLEREDAAQPLGLADMRQLHQQFKKEWPDVATYRGHRGSGALAGRENNVQAVRMEPRDPEITEILKRRELLADSSRASLPGILVNGMEQGRPASLAQRINELPQAPRRELLPSDFPIQRDKSLDGNTEFWKIPGPEGRGAVNAQVNRKEGTVQITGSDIGDRAKGKGVGLAMYQRLIDEAHRNDFAAHSDNLVSQDAQRIYHALGERGYEIQRNPRAVETDRGLHVTGPSEPVFTVWPGRRAYADPAASLPGTLLSHSSSPQEGDDLASMLMRYGVR